MPFVWAFLVGGGMCALAQVVVDLTPLSTAHVMVLFIVLGVVAAGLGLYEPLVRFAGAGASVPLPGFGNVLVQGIFKEVGARGPEGLMSGGLTASAAGITMAVIFGALAALVARPRG